MLLHKSCGSSFLLKPNTYTNPTVWRDDNSNSDGNVDFNAETFSNADWSSGNSNPDSHHDNYASVDRHGNSDGNADANLVPDDDQNTVEHAYVNCHSYEDPDRCGYGSPFANGVSQWNATIGGEWHLNPCRESSRHTSFSTSRSRGTERLSFRQPR